MCFNIRKCYVCTDFFTWLFDAYLMYICCNDEHNMKKYHGDELMGVT